MFARLVADGATPDALLTTLKQGEAIETDIQVNGPLLPRLVAPAAGIACVALREDKYCRAVIETMNLDRVNILFVDYGNHLSLPMNK